MSGGRTELLLAAVGTAGLAPRLGELWATASRRGRLVAALQVAAALAVARGRLLRGPPPWAVAGATAAALACDMLPRRVRPAGARAALWAVLGAGMVPCLAEGQDAPALVAMLLGLCLRQLRASAVILLMLTGGEALEERALRRAGDALRALLERRPGTAQRVAAERQHGDNDADGYQLETVAVEALRPGDLVFVKSGESVPVDGELEVDEGSGDGRVDEALLTGETAPVSKRSGDRVLGGSWNRGSGPLWVRVRAPYGESLVFLLRSKLEEALSRKAEIEIECKRLVSAFTPFTFAVAAVAHAVSRWRGRGPREAWEAVLAVFMSATPCPAGIGVPIAMLSGMSRASRRLGCTVKAGTGLEALAGVTTVVFDKTGTLTNGEPTVSEFRITHCTEQDVNELHVLQLLASAEQLSTHPLAKAICAFYQERAGQGQGQGQGRLLEAASAESDAHGSCALASSGVSAWVGAFHVRVGSYGFVHGSSSATSPTPASATASPGACFRVSTRADQGLVAEGTLCFADALRPSASSAVDALRALGLEVRILSGDPSGHVAHVAGELGIERFETCWPHEKAERVEALRREGHVVLMVGDGSNDAAALAAADVGLCVGASNLAAESADVVLMSSDLNALPELVVHSRRVVRIAKDTVRYGMGASLLQMTLAATGLVSPFASAVGQEAIDLGSVVHALRALS